MGEKEVDLEEIKRILKDADMYEVNLTNDELRSYYAALKNSENTANEEEISRNLNKTFEDEKVDVVEKSDEEDVKEKSVPIKTGKKLFTPKSWTCFKKTQKSVQKDQNTDDTTELLDVIKPKDATKIIFGFNEMLESLVEKTNFDTASYDYKFIPIQCTETFLKGDIRTKAKILYSYHSKMLNIKDNLARQTIYPAPTPKPMVSVDKFPSLYENNDNCTETYVSRSGRQTKRKFYCDENSLDDDFLVNNKKSKNIEDDWSKKTEINKDCNILKTSDKINPINEEISEMNKTDNEYDDKIVVITVNENKEIIEKCESEEIKVESKTKPITKPQNSKKLSNPEIMERSKLFRDSQKRGPRAEILFDKMVEETEKKEKEEKAREEFEKTLEIENNEDYHKDDSSGNERDDIITVVDEEPKRRRIIPPIPGRKGIGRRRNVDKDLTPLSVVITSLPAKSKENSTSSVAADEPIVISPNKKRTYNRKQTNTSKKNTASQKDTQDCPICDKTFPKGEIQNHAATCGDDTEVVPHSSMKLAKLTCEICDAVIPVSTQYEVHVKDCIRAKQLEEIQ